MRSQWPLVGRAEELALARESISGTSGRHGLVLAGLAGVGKSRLARQLLAEARDAGRHCHLLYATASARSVPLGVFADFAPIFGADPLRRVHEVINALADPGSGPDTIVAVDDAHLLDEQSALVIHQLTLRRAATVVLTMRTGEPAPDAVVALTKDEWLPRLEVQPLSAADVALLLEEVLGGQIETSSAQRLWRYTQGNVLYLRQLIDDDRAGERLVRRSGVWVWASTLDVSPTLIDLINHNTARYSADAVEVVDLVAIADPLEMSVLQSLSTDAAIDEAEAQGAVSVNPRTGMAHLAHPLYGEARRRRLGTLQRASLGRRVAEAIAQLCPPTAPNLVRRAVLIAGDDRPGDAELLTKATDAAVHLLDLMLAIDLADRARACVDNVETQVQYAFALMLAGRSVEGEDQLAALAKAVAATPHRAQVALLRACNLAFNLGRASDAEAVLDAAQESAGAAGLAPSFDALRAALFAVRAESASAVPAIRRVLDVPGVEPVTRALSVWGLLAALGDLGALDDVERVADQYRESIETHPATSHLRYGLGLSVVYAMHLAGALGDMRPLTARLHEQASDHPPSLAITGLQVGLSDAVSGDLRASRLRLHESLATYEFRSAVTEHSGVLLTLVYAMMGDWDAARRQLADTPQHYIGESPAWDPLRSLAVAWTEAAQGRVTEAVRLTREAAMSLSRAGRPAREVWSLQTATQFGDASTAGRLAELALLVQGPRAPAAAAHAAALASHDGAALLRASGMYEAFGDRVAAADAAAHAAAAFERAGLRGSALTAATIASRLADETGALTPALQAVTTAAVLTPRQREIVSLIAAGLSNRDIAARLHMSVRSVEGHVFRASQRNGVKTRDALAGLVQRPQSRH